MIFRYFILFSILCLPTLSFSQIEKEATQSDSTQIFVKNTDNFIRDASGEETVQYLRGNVQMFQDSIFMFCDSAILANNTLRALGNVIIIHEDSIRVFADSLFYDGNKRQAELYDRVVLENGNQKLFTNQLNYDLNTKLAVYQDTAYMENNRTRVKSIKGTYNADSGLAKFKEEVIVRDTAFVMNTDSLLYDTKNDYATFISYTTIQRKDQLITCHSGYYDLENDKAKFGSQATLSDAESNASAQEIEYFGKEERLILSGDAKYEKGVEYASAQIMTIEESTDDVLLEGNAFFKNDKQTVKGERIKYNRTTEDIDVQGDGQISSESLDLKAKQLSFDKIQNLGVAEQEVVWIDTINNYRIDSERVLYNDSTNYVRAERVDDIRPLFKNTLDGNEVYIASDTLEFYKTYPGFGNDTTRIDSTEIGLDTMATQIDTIPILIDTTMTQKIDSATIGIDTITTELDSINHFTATQNVKILFDDLSAVCGKLDYNDKDSVFVLHSNPTMWTDSVQFFADTIRIFMVNDEPKYMDLINNSMMISEVGDIYFNQIIGKRFHAVFDSSEIKSLEVKGNSQSIYYMTNDADELVALNNTSCSYMTFFFSGKEIDDIKFFEDPTSKLIPIKRIEKTDTRLPGFTWNPEDRPVTVEDLLKAEPIRLLQLSPEAQVSDSLSVQGIEDLPAGEEKTQEIETEKETKNDPKSGKDLRNLDPKIKDNEKGK